MDCKFQSLKNKTVLVTGAGSGIGKAIVTGFSEQGCNVIMWGHHEVSPDFIPQNSVYYCVELENEKSIEKAFEENVIESNREVCVLVNCAGYTSSAPSDKYSLQEFDKTMKINLYAPFIISKLVANRLIEEKKQGSIINITSIGAQLAFPNNPAYVASKAGLSHMAKAFALDWGKYGIRVNNVGPGYTQTKMTAGSWDDKRLRGERSDRTMLGRWAHPEELVGTVLFLASDSAAYITGQDIYVDGGWTGKGL